MIEKDEILHEWDRPGAVSVYESREGFKIALKLFRLGVILGIGLGVSAYLLLKYFVAAEFDLNWEKMFLVFGAAVVVIAGVTPVFFAWMSKFETVKFRITEKGIIVKGPRTVRWDKIKYFWFDEIEGLEGLTVIRIRASGRNERIFLPGGAEAEDIVRMIEQRIRQVEKPGKYYFKGKIIPRLAMAYLTYMFPAGLGLVYSTHYVSEKYLTIYSYGCAGVVFVPAIFILVFGKRREKKMEEELLPEDYIG